MHRYDKKEERDGMRLNLPVKEMEALRRLQHKTGITRTELIRQAIRDLLAKNGEIIEIESAKRNSPIKEKTVGKTHRHAGEFLEMPLAELYPNLDYLMSKFGRRMV